MRAPTPPAQSRAADITKSSRGVRKRARPRGAREHGTDEKWNERARGRKREREEGERRGGEGEEYICKTFVGIEDVNLALINDGAISSEKGKR